MVKRKKYLWQHPSGRWYVRKNGQYQRVHSEPGTPEFDFEYWEILRGRRSEARHSWSVLIEDLRHTEKWKGVSPRYRRDLEPVLTYLNNKIGKRDVQRLTPSDIYAAMDKNKHRTRFANYIPTAVSMLSKLAIRRGWRKDNPASGIEALKVPKERQKPHIPWPDWAIKKMREEGESLPQLIFEIGVGSVQRPGDWVGFTWGDYDGTNLELTQNKTGKVLQLPCTENLKAALDRTKKDIGFIPHPSRHILSRSDGSAMSYHTMARIMLAERKRLGLTAFDQHALRYRGVMELAWANCTDDEIASYSGHTSKAMIVKYAGDARQIMQARQAAAKRK